eukprot:2180672-Amphidinium_carterae.1
MCPKTEAVDVYLDLSQAKVDHKMYILTCAIDKKVRLSAVIISLEQLVLRHPKLAKQREHFF